MHTNFSTFFHKQDISPFQSLALFPFPCICWSTFSIYYLLEIELRTNIFCLHIEPSSHVASVMLTALHFSSVSGPQRGVYLVLNLAVFYILYIFSVCPEQRQTWQHELNFNINLLTRRSEHVLEIDSC